MNDPKFEQLYSKIVKNNGRSLELSRSEAQGEAMKNIGIAIVLIIIGIAFYYIIYGVYQNKILTNTYTFYYVFFAVIIYIFYLKMHFKKSKLSQYRKDFKTKVITEILNSFEENIEYFPRNGISATIYNEGEFDERYDAYSSEDLMRGNLKNNCRFSMGEIITQKKVESDGKSYYYETFHGMLANIQTPKPFKARLYLRQDIKDKNILTKTFSKKHKFDNLRIELDSQDFEKIFDVYCSDKIIAVQLLTADVMQLLIDFQEKMNMPYEITIKNNNIYIRFFSDKMFEAASIVKHSLDKETLYKYYKMLDFTFSLTNKLINVIKDTEYNN